MLIKAATGLIAYSFFFLNSSTYLFGQLSSPLPNSLRVESLLQEMTLHEKIGQMTQANRRSIERNLHHIRELGLGSLLNGGDDTPMPSTPENWRQTLTYYQTLAAQSRLGIPLLYGIDAVHGHALVDGAVVFPHNIGLGAANDPELVKNIAFATAKNVAATGANWDFSPAVSIPHDIRWGRTFEGFGENQYLVDKLATQAVIGLQTPYHHSYPLVGATLKHFIGDGGTTWGTSQHPYYKIDQGDTVVDDNYLREVHLKAYEGGLRNEAMAVMVSYNRVRGSHMHSHHYWITEVLKKELQFDGVVISDWLGVFWQPGTTEEKIERSINAGIDMVMAVDQYETFIFTLAKLVEDKRVSMERIDDAVRRILTMKEKLGLFDLDRKVPSTHVVGSDHDKRLARHAVQKSAVLLKNEKNILPLSHHQSIAVLGEASDDIGSQCGGWTTVWQGKKGNHIPGVTIFEGIRSAAHRHQRVDFYKKIEEIPSNYQVDTTVVVVAENPYAEGFGDRDDLELSWEQKDLIRVAREKSRNTILLILSGRPLILSNEVLAQSDVIIAGWLPGTEGGSGLADLLFGKASFSGKLPYTWPKNLNGYKGLPIAEDNVLYPYGFGLTLH